jgi:hypothetical protein
MAKRRNHEGEKEFAIYQSLQPPPSPAPADAPSGLLLLLLSSYHSSLATPPLMSLKPPCTRLNDAGTLREGTQAPIGTLTCTRPSPPHHGVAERISTSPSSGTHPEVR